MKLAQGHRSITFPLVVLFFGSFFLTILFPQYWIILVITAAAVVFTIQFFRDPERTPDNSDPHTVLAPADGVLFEITTDGQGNQIFRIRMRFWDVHVNRMPVEGRLYASTKVAGLYLPIIPGVNKLSKNKNAHQTLQFKHPHGFNFQVIQISGILAYRCVSYWQPSDQVIQKGVRLGIIRFGSETDLYIPEERIKQSLPAGKKVRAGQTVLCLLKDLA